MCKWTPHSRLLQGLVHMVSAKVHGDQTTPGNDALELAPDGAVSRVLLDGSPLALASPSGRSGVCPKCPLDGGGAGKVKTSPPMRDAAYAHTSYTSYTCHAQLRCAARAGAEKWSWTEPAGSWHNRTIHGHWPNGTYTCEIHHETSLFPPACRRSGGRAPDFPMSAPAPLRRPSPTWCSS